MATIRDRYVLEVDTGTAERNVGGIRGAIGGLSNSLKGMGPLIAGAAAAFGAFAGVSAIQDRINDFDELAKRARAVGAATEESFQGFQVLTGFLGEAGIAAGETDAILRRLTNASAQAADGNDKFAAIFEKLGDSVRDVNGNFVESPALFEEVAKAVQDGTLSMAEATDLFGRSAGPNLVNILQEMAANGTDVSAALEDVAQHTNIVDIEAARNAEKFNDNIGRLKEGLGQLMTDAITPLLPILVDMSERVLAAMPSIIEGVRDAFTTLEPVFSFIGTVVGDLLIPIFSKLFELLGTIASAIRPLADTIIPLLTSAFEGIIAVVEVVIGAFTRVIDAITNIAGAASNLRDSVSGSFSSMSDSLVGSAENAWSGVTGWFGKMYDDLWGNSIIPDLVEGVTGGFGDMTSTIEDETQSTVANIKNGFASIFGSVAGGLGNTIRTGLNEARNTFGEFGNMFRNAVGGITGTSNAVGDQLQETFSGANLEFGDFGTNIEVYRELEQQLRNLEQPLTNFRDSIDTVRESTDQQREIQEQVNTAFDEYLETLETIVENEELRRESLETLNDLNETQRDLLGEITEKFQENSEAMQSIIEVNQSYVDSNTLLKDSAEELRQQIIENIATDDELKSTQESLLEAFRSTAQSMQDYVSRIRDVASNTQTAIGQTNSLTEALARLERQSRSTQAATSQGQFNPIGFGSSVPSLNLGSLFAGFFATGGMIPAGRFGVVGEAGPELVQGPASVTPFDSIGSSVTYNINAVDARSFQQLIAADPSFLHAVVQRGARKIPGRSA